VFAIDIETCPDCGGTLRVSACLAVLRHISTPDELATCALFLLSAAASFVFFLPIGAMLLVIGLRQGASASVDSYEEMSVDDPGSERPRQADQLSRFGPIPHLHKGKE
jgi:hypothetical protein